MANHRSELKCEKSVNQSVVRIQIMSHHMSQSCETLHCPSDFHATLLPYYFSFQLHTYVIKLSKARLSEMTNAQSDLEAKLGVEAKKIVMLKDKTTQFMNKLKGHQSGLKILVYYLSDPKIKKSFL